MLACTVAWETQCSPFKHPLGGKHLAVVREQRNITKATIIADSDQKLEVGMAWSKFHGLQLVAAL